MDLGRVQRDAANVDGSVEQNYSFPKEHQDKSVFVAFFDDYSVDKPRLSCQFFKSFSRCHNTNVNVTAVVLNRFPVG